MPSCFQTTSQTLNPLHRCRQSFTLFIYDLNGGVNPKLLSRSKSHPDRQWEKCFVQGSTAKQGSEIDFLAENEVCRQLSPCGRHRLCQHLHSVHTARKKSRKVCCHFLVNKRNWKREGKGMSPASTIQWWPTISPPKDGCKRTPTVVISVSNFSVNTRSFWLEKVSVVDTRAWKGERKEEGAGHQKDVSLKTGFYEGPPQNCQADNNWVLLWIVKWKGKKDSFPNLVKNGI